MLTSDLLRASTYRGKLKPAFLRSDVAPCKDSAEALVDIFRKSKGVSLAALREEVAGLVEVQDQPVLWKGLARVLEGRCSLVPPPVQLGWENRFKLFSRAAEIRLAGGMDGKSREALVAEEAAVLGLDPDTFLHSLYADVPGNERVESFEDITWERLVAEYNLALAQGIVLRAENLRLLLEPGTSRQLRGLVHAAKFHQLHWHISTSGADGEVEIQLDGPLSLFEATTKYGVRLACFLPTAMAIPGVCISGRIQWGKKQKKQVEWEYQSGMAELPNRHFVPAGPTPEITGFQKLWSETQPGWEIAVSRRVIPCGGKRFWVPDFEINCPSSGECVLLEMQSNPTLENLEKWIQALESKPGLPWMLLCKGKPEKVGIHHPGIGWFRTFPSPEKVADQLKARAIKPLPGSGFHPTDEV